MKKRFMLGETEGCAWAGLRFKSRCLQYRAYPRCRKWDVALTGLCRYIFYDDFSFCTCFRLLCIVMLKYLLLLDNNN